MRELFQAHLLFLKNKPFSLLFWLLFPIVVAVIFIQMADASKSEVRIPIALVVKDDSALTKALEKSIQSNELLHVTVSNEDKALHNLRKYEYDSVFIIPEDFSTRLTNGETKNLVQAYRSDRTIFFEPIKEMVISHIQSAAGRVKAANTVQQLSEHMIDKKKWSKEEVIETANAIEKDQYLLHTLFSYTGEEQDINESHVVSPWFPWSCAALLAAFFIFDWVIKEGRQSAFSRLVFMRYANNYYLLYGLLLYTLLLIIFDFIAIVLFSIFYNGALDLNFFIAILFYRLVINGIAFIIACLFNNTYVYYCVGLIIMILAVITSSSFLKSNFTQTILELNPIHLFSNEQISIFWTAFLLIAIPLSFRFRKERTDA